MPRISRTTNPTGLTTLDRKLFAVRVQTATSGVRSFWLEHFNFQASKLASGLVMSCVAHAGNTEQFFRMGHVDAIDHEVKYLSNLSTSKPLRFRFIVHEEGAPLLVGFADGVRAVDEAGLLGSSLVDIEPADLHGPAWKLSLPENLRGSDKPVLLVERRIFPTAHAAANDPWMAVLVMPEVFRQVVLQIAEHSESLDDPETWIYPWAEFLKAMEASDLPEQSDGQAQAQAEWADGIVEVFCARATMRRQMDRATNELGGGV